VSTLRLTHLDFERVEFVLLNADGRELRPVVVRVGSGRTWRQAVHFPNLVSEGGASLGDPTLDDEARERAAELLVVLEASVRIARATGAA
jgi:hypothetical protein